MEIDNQQAQKIKTHLLEQLENFPEEKKEQVKQQIISMSNKDVEEFITKNQLTHLNQQCIFCSIVDEKTPSYKIAEDNQNIAILEINPLTKAHTLIVPKNHSATPSKEFTIKIGELIQKKLNAKEIKLQEKEILGHKTINIIPIYTEGDEENLKSGKRKKAPEQELKQIQELLTISKQKIESKTYPEEQKDNSEKPKQQIPKLPPRIP